MKGGVVILAMGDYQASEVLAPLYSCPIIILSQDEMLKAIKIAGIYLPPKAVTALGRVFEAYRFKRCAET